MSGPVSYPHLDPYHLDDLLQQGTGVRSPPTPNWVARMFVPRSDDLHLFLLRHGRIR
jgi:hypothetical protein